MKITVEMEPHEVKQLVQMFVFQPEHAVVQQQEAPRAHALPSQMVRPAEIRRWAREEKGLTISSKGHVPKDVKALYDAEHS